MKFPAFLPLALVGCLALAAAASAQPTQAYVDFGSTVTTLGAAPNDPNRIWNNYTSPNEGAFLSNIVTTTGAPTGFSIFTLRRFNTVNTNGTTASPIFNANATVDSLVGNLETFGGLTNIIPVIQLTGLQPSLLYSFTFFASRTGVSDNRETRYTLVGNNTAFGDLNASNNTANTVTVPGLLADAQGQITLTMTAGPNNNNAMHFTYLGIMIVSYDAIPEPGTVALLAFAGVGALGVAWRRRSRWLRSAAVCAAFLLAVGSSSAGQVMINYGGVSAGLWNNATNPAATANFGSLPNLIDFGTGASTGISMTIGGLNRFGDPANHAGPTSVTGAAAAAGFVPSSVLDSFYGSTNAFNGSSSNPRVVFGGLDFNTSYSFTIFAGRAGVGGDVRSGLYSLSGATTVSGVLNASENNSQVLVLSGLRPDVSGQIVLSIVRDITNNNVSGFTYLNALRIDTAPIPEPATWALLAAGLGGVLALRRRRSREN